MNDFSVKLLDLINKEYTVNEIVSELNLPYELVYKMLRELKQIGMDFSRKYYDSGDIVYIPKKDILLPSKSNTVDIITSPNSDSFRALLISDLHIGSIYERRDVWDTIVNYCINEGIHVVIMAGDFLDGINIGRPDSKIHDNSLEQIEYAVKNYPFDKSIIYFITFGNHDVDSLVSYGIDFSTYLQNFRHDIIPVGYGHGRINIKNDKILVTHPLCIGINNNLDLTSNYLLIKGHHHSTKSIIGSNGNCSLTVPSLSNIFLTEDTFLPGAIDLSIKFKNGFFETVYYEHLLINDGKVYAISSTQYSITPSKDRKYDGHIKHEDDLFKRRVLKKDEN